MNSTVEIPTILIVGLFLASVFLGIVIGAVSMETAIAADNNDPTTTEPPSATDDIGELDRNIDEEAGVVCYSPRAYSGGIDCLPLVETDLANTGDH